MLRIAVFDLDGTLLDTLDDLHATVNRTLARAGRPPRTREEIRAFVGDGVEMLVRRALSAGPIGVTVSEDVVGACLADFKTDYAASCAERTAPYAGVSEMLDALRDSGVKIAVVSNKFDAAVRALCAQWFGERIDVAVGERESDGVRKKPYPDTVFEALSALDIPRGAELLASDVRVTYIGDSEVDIATARNAGIPCVSVTWGFRDADLLRAHGATALADTPSEVLRLLLSD